MWCNKEILKDTLGITWRNTTTYLSRVINGRYWLIGLVLFQNVSLSLFLSNHWQVYLTGTRMMLKLTYFHLDVLIDISNLRCPKLNSYSDPTNLLLPQTSSLPSCSGLSPLNHPWLGFLILYYIGTQILWSSTRI